jgi:hypothetical protein
MAQHDPFDPMNIGNADLQEDDQVGVYKTEAGPVIMPVSMRRKLGESELLLVTDMQHEVMAIQSAQRRIDQLVIDGRERGLSWAAIGWSTGLTAEGARLKWGETSN